jgi:hypothetical protein
LRGWIQQHANLTLSSTVEIPRLLQLLKKEGIPHTLAGVKAGFFWARHMPKAKASKKQKPANGTVRMFVLKHARLNAAHPTDEIRHLMDAMKKAGIASTFGSVSSNYYWAKRKVAAPTKGKAKKRHRSSYAERAAAAAAGTRPIDHIRRFFATANGHAFAPSEVVDYVTQQGVDYHGAAPGKMVGVVLGTLKKRHELKQTPEGKWTAAKQLQAAPPT